MSGIWALPGIWYGGITDARGLGLGLRGFTDAWGLMHGGITNANDLGQGALLMPDIWGRAWQLYRGKHQWSRCLASWHCLAPGMGALLAPGV